VLVGAAAGAMAIGVATLVITVTGPANQHAASVASVNPLPAQVATPSLAPTVPPTLTVPPTPAVTVAPAAPPTAAAALVVGDSITLGCADALRADLGAGTFVDGKVGRQFSTATSIVAAWAEAHPGPVVIDLGANGTVQADDVESLLAAAGDRRVVLVGVSVPRRWRDGNNAVLSAAAGGHGPKVVFVDWAAIVAAHPGSVGPDQVHPTIPGRALLANAVAAALRA
jgi:lysophospholipase L1-like esterase